jgi:anti-sigma B factor antagonist
MEITTKQYKHCDLLSIQGKVDSYTAPDLTKAIEALNDKGQFKIVLDKGK